MKERVERGHDLAEGDQLILKLADAIWRRAGFPPVPRPKKKKGG